VFRVLYEPLFAERGNCVLSVNRVSKKVPDPCISVAATYAFQ
jgi:hypothetical protein